METYFVSFRTHSNIICLNVEVKATSITDAIAQVKDDTTFIMSVVRG